MPWTVEFVPNESIIKYLIYGAATLRDIQDASRQGLLLSQKENVWDVLVQAKGLEPMLRIADLYELPVFYSSLHIPPQAKVGVVIPKGELFQRGFQFYEDVCVNRGFRVKLFTEDEAAMEWLKGGRGY